MLVLNSPAGCCRPAGALLPRRAAASRPPKFASSGKPAQHARLAAPVAAEGQWKGGAPATTAEEEANKKRWEESGNSQGSVDQWRWTLNWDAVTDNIIVGSCPRSPADIDTIAAEAGCDAIICLQCSLCHDALQIDWQPLRDRAVAQGVLMTKVSVRDFDHNDQALMLPEAVKMLHLLLSMNRKVYVHCTAGINRATLTVVGYLTFIQGMQLDAAESMVKRMRPQAHPYIDCWRTVRGRLLQGRVDEVKAVARKIAAESGSNGGSQDDWLAAEMLLIRELFDRQVEASLTLVDSITDFHAGQFATTASLLTHQAEALRRKGRGGAAPGDAPAAEEQVLEGCVLALEIAQEATSKVDELKAAMSEVAKAAGDALDSVPPLRAGTSGVSGNSGGNSVNGSGKQGVW